MSFLLPGFLVAAGAIAACTVLLHFIVTRQPDLWRLPTARFAPERAIQARARVLEPKNLLLLAVRVALVLAVGAALARPVLSPARRDRVRIVLLDRSRAVASAHEAADSARALLGDRDVLIVFDSAATVLESGAPDHLARLSLATRAGRLSTGLIGALRGASRIRDRADSIELVVVSPLVREEIDAATDSLRALWPAGIRLVRTKARTDSGARPPVTFEGALDDPLRVALLPSRISASGSASVRLVRRLATAADSAWAAGAGRVLVVWPALREVPGGWTRETVDTVGAVATGSAVVVAPFVRTVIHRGGIASGPSAPRDDSVSARVIARWVDGEPAAIEEARVAGCIRTVTIDVPVAGDLVLDARFAKLVAALCERCGGGMDLTPLDEAARAQLAGDSGGHHALAAGFAAPEQVPSPWSRWLLLAAVLLVAAESVLRRRTAP